MFLICSLLISTPLFSIFDVSPWIIIENKTKLDFECKFEAIYYPSDDEQITLTLNDSNINVVFDNGEDENENEFLKITLTFVSYAEQAFVLNPIFSQDGIVFNPQITCLDFTHPSLQIFTFCNPTHIDHRYFSIEHQQEDGIITKMHAISMYVKCLNNFKQMIRNLLAAAMNATNLLPY